MRFDQLAGEVRRFSEKIEPTVKRATDKVAIAIVKTAAAKTPVDTTKALSNWQIGLGGSPNGVLAARIPGTGGSTRLASIASTVVAAELDLQPRRVGIDIYVSNNAPYIDDLNNGTISQQPGGFVEAAELAGQKQINATRLDIR